MYLPFGRRVPGGRRLAHRLVRSRPICRLVRLRPARPGANSHLGDAVAFFTFDVPKVLLLLLGIVTVVTLIRGFFPPEKVRTTLVGRGELAGTVGAAGLGIVTPFCSCSAVPLFIGFVEASPRSG